MTTPCCDITIPDGSATLELNSNVKSGNQTLTCTNVLGRSFQGKAELVPVDARAKIPSWLKVSPERIEFEKGASHVIDVSAEPPAAELAGAGTKLSYRLRVSNSERPNEETSESRDLALSLAPSGQKPELPKWLIPVIAGAVVFLGLAIALIIWLSGTDGPGDPCGAQFACPEKLVCNKEQNLCVGDVGYETCKDPADCVTANCVAGVCEYPKPGARCKEVDGKKICPITQRCIEVSSGTWDCLSKGKQTCSMDTECASHLCNNDHCSSDDGTCQISEDCGPAFECRNGKCGYADGQPCKSKDARSGGLCFSGKCVDDRCVASNCGGACGAGTKCDEASGRCTAVLASSPASAPTAAAPSTTAASVNFVDAVRNMGVVRPVRIRVNQ